MAARPDVRRLDLASMYKVAGHAGRVRAYLRAEPILPVTLELDLTNDCTRFCPECPSTTASRHDALGLPLLDRLLGLLGGGTPGLLLTGGEPTMSPLFPPALRVARERGFEQIVVVTNGSLVDTSPVADALLAHASAIRLSLYDWDGGPSDALDRTLGRIERLRVLIDRERSPLEIGVSALTSARRVGLLAPLAESVRAAGAHWIYFHPLCSRWGIGQPELDSQTGVLETVLALRARNLGGFDVFTFPERYDHTMLEFEAYHAGHFLLVIGADGKNYLGPEVKYQPEHAIADLKAGWHERFLRDAARLARLRCVDGRSYPGRGSRHRSVLYNHFIERLGRKEPGAEAGFERAAAVGFRFPHIL